MEVRVLVMRIEMGAIILQCVSLDKEGFQWCFNVLILTIQEDVLLKY
jgi:hypothetical protein